jgi:hypothetical protein
MTSALIGTPDASRRSYGCALSNLIDQPMNPATRRRLISSIATTLINGEEGTGYRSQPDLLVWRSWIAEHCT